MALKDAMVITDKRVHQCTIQREGLERTKSNKNIQGQ